MLRQPIRVVCFFIIALIHGEPALFLDDTFPGNNNSLQELALSGFQFLFLHIPAYELGRADIILFAGEKAVSERQTDTNQRSLPAGKGAGRNPGLQTPGPRGAFRAPSAHRQAARTIRNSSVLPGSTKTEPVSQLCGFPCSLMLSFPRRLMLMQRH